MDGEKTDKIKRRSFWLRGLSAFNIGFGIFNYVVISTPNYLANISDNLPKVHRAKDAIFGKGP